MGQLVPQHEDLLYQIQNEMKHSDCDKMILEPLQEEHQSFLKLQSSLEAMVNEMQSIMQRLRLLLQVEKEM